MTLSEKMQKMINEPEILVGKEKGKLKDIKNVELILRDFAFINIIDKETGEIDKVPVVVFDEFPDMYFYGGAAFSQLFAAFDEGDHEALIAEGMKIILTDATTRDNKAFTKLRIL